MLSLDEILSELRAIEEFDALFLARSEHYPEEVVGFAFRQLRKQELLQVRAAQRNEKVDFRAD